MFCEYIYKNSNRSNKLTASLAWKYLNHKYHRYISVKIILENICSLFRLNSKQNSEKLLVLYSRWTIFLAYFPPDCLAVLTSFWKQIFFKYQLLISTRLPFLQFSSLDIYWSFNSFYPYTLKIPNCQYEQVGNIWAKYITMYPWGTKRWYLIYIHLKELYLYSCNIPSDSLQELVWGTTLAQHCWPSVQTSMGHKYTTTRSAMQYANMLHSKLLGLGLVPCSCSNPTLALLLTAYLDIGIVSQTMFRKSQRQVGLKSSSYIAGNFSCSFFSTG